MNVKWTRKLILPVLAMLAVYYLHNFGERTEPINSVDSIGDWAQLVTADANLEDFHVVYSLHDSNYLVRTMAEVNPDALSWVHSVFDALSNDQAILGQVTSLVPPGAYLISYETDGSDLTLNLSREFLDYDPAVERQLLSSLVWSYTENSEFERVFFRIENEPVNNLNSPLNVGSGLTRAMGINLEVETQSANSQQVMLYFVAGSSSSPYLVPVTRIVDASVDPVVYAVNALSTGPRGSHYLSYVNHGANLLEEPFLAEDGVLTLNFDGGFFFDQGQTRVSSVAIMQLVMTLTEQEGIESVAVLVNDSSQVFDDQTRPINVPANRLIVDPFVQGN